MNWLKKTFRFREKIKKLLKKRPTKEEIEKLAKKSDNKIDDEIVAKIKEALSVEDKKSQDSE